MEQIIKENGNLVDMNKVELLSLKGSEFVVYKYLNEVLKIYKKDYPLGHLTKDELNILKKLVTKRILMPSGLLFHNNGELIGYEMPYIGGRANILDCKVATLVQELEIIKQDVEILTKNLVMLLDINLNNTIYNGQIYLIDPGNYLINKTEEMFGYLEIEALGEVEKINLLREWNYKKINMLIDSLVFLEKLKDNKFQYLAIIHFLMNLREKEKILDNLDILKFVLNPTLRVNEAIDVFAEKYKKDIEEEKEKYLTLYK